MEEVIKIEGKHALEGTVRISGSKNATVALILPPFWQMDQLLFVEFLKYLMYNPCLYC